jgi:hypothetical protein
MNAEHIFGPDIGSLKGKTVRQGSDQVRSGNLVPIPALIMKKYQKIILCIDVMKVNKMPFLVTIVRAVDFGTVAWLKNAEAGTLMKHVNDVNNIYMKRGFSLEIAEVDGQFEPLRGQMAAIGVTLNKCSREEHVPVAERRIRTIKERCRCICNTLPYKKIPKMLVVQMVSTSNFWLNVFPPKDGVSRNISPRELLTGLKIDFNKHIQLEFGEYVQVHDEHNNTMQTRTTGAIATKPTGNAQGGHWFYSLSTGRMIDRRRWTRLPMPNDVIERMNVLARSNPAGLHFTNMNNEDYEDYEDYDSDSDSDSDSASDSDSESNNSDPDDGGNAGHPEGVNLGDESVLPDPPDENTSRVGDAQQTTPITEPPIIVYDNVPEQDTDMDDNEEEEIPPSSYIEGVPPAETPTGPRKPIALRRLTDDSGILPPTMVARTRQQTRSMGENLATTTIPDEQDVTVNTEIPDEQGGTVSLPWNPVKGRKHRRLERKKKLEMLTMLQEENKQQLRSRKKNIRRRLNLKSRSGPAQQPTMAVRTIDKSSDDDKPKQSKVVTEDDSSDDGPPVMHRAEYSSEDDSSDDEPPVMHRAADSSDDDTDSEVETVFDKDGMPGLKKRTKRVNFRSHLRDHLKSQQKPGTVFPHDSCSQKELVPELEAIALTQFNLKKGLQEFGEDGITALGKEMGQLHTRKVGVPVDSNSLSRDQKRASLRYLMFLTKKRCGRIKARGCADGRKQRETTNKEDASAPTVAIESVLLSATIDAMQRRDVATVDIPGAFMQADIDELVHVKFEGKIAEMLVRIDPKLYRKYVKNENGKTVLYVELRKALYGTLKAALLFWKLLSSKLVEWGFIINPYDWCVANRIVKGKQQTVLWHVDDLKISHVDEAVNTELIKLLESEFGKEAPLTITRGKVHDYLGMTLDYTEDGKVKIRMEDYVEKMLADLPEDADMDGESPTPAANHLFQVNDKQPKVDEKKAQLFHTYVAKSLFLCKRARPDIQTAVAFLATRVKECGEDDYKKLRRMIQF